MVECRVPEVCSKILSIRDSSTKQDQDKLTHTRKTLPPISVMDSRDGTRVLDAPTLLNPTVVTAARYARGGKGASTSAKCCGTPVSFQFDNATSPRPPSFLSTPEKLLGLTADNISEQNPRILEPWTARVGHISNRHRFHLKAQTDYSRGLRAEQQSLRMLENGFIPTDGCEKCELEF